MNATVHMNGIQWKIKTGYWISEHQGLCRQHIPSFLSHTILSFTSINSRKIKWAMDKSVNMGEIDPATNGKQMVTCGTFLGRIRWSYQVGIKVAV
jgi:hypothetical protein